MRDLIRWSAGIAFIILAAPPALAADVDEDSLDRTPKDCVLTYRIKKTDVVDGKTILFYMRGGPIYANILDRECPGLEKQKRFMHETHGSQLCDIDMITVLEQWGASLQRGFSCRLGQFLPVSAEEAEDLRQIAKGAVEGNPDVDVEEVEIDSEGHEVGAGSQGSEERSSGDPASGTRDP